MFSCFFMFFLWFSLSPQLQVKVGAGDGAVHPNSGGLGLCGRDQQLGLSHILNWAKNNNK